MAVKLLEGSPGHESQLAELGLKAEWVREAIGMGNVERKQAVVGHAAKSAPGYYAWNGVLTSLSRQCCSDGWHRRDPSSLPTLLNPSTKTVLTVSSGNSLTGFSGPNVHPSTKNPKGELTRELQRNNWESENEGLFETDKKSVSAFLDDVVDFGFWVLLVYFDRQTLEIRYEISRPLESDARGYTRSWKPRIILPPYKLDDGDGFDGTDPNDGFGDPYDVVVEKK